MPAGRSVDVQTLLNESPISPFQYVVFALCLVVVLLDGFDTAAIGYVAPSVSEEWKLQPGDIKWVLTAALWGLAVGALCAGPLADFIGRKIVLIAAAAIFGAACLLAAFAADITQLFLLRLIAGLGFGAAMPNAVTMVSEYCPEGRRATATNAMFCGFPLGAALGGFLAAWMMPTFGWRSVFVLGGIVPLVLAALMLVLLPKSVRYMVAKRQPIERIRGVLRRISASAAEASDFVLSERKPAAEGASGLSIIFSRNYIIGSLMLWITYFMGLVIFYGLVNWMPTLLKEAGLGESQRTWITSLFPLGGVGAIFFGWLMDRFNGNVIIAIGFALTTLAVFLIGQVDNNLGLLMVAVFLGGLLMNTAQSSLPALAAGFYPTQGRATGVSWMLGVGRLGGILGTWVMGGLASQHLPNSQLFAYAAAPGLIAAAALIIKQLAHPESAVDRAVARSEAVGH